jgi:hypothetical protein
MWEEKEKEKEMPERVYPFVCPYMSTFIISSFSNDIVNNIIFDDSGILLIDGVCHLASHKDTEEGYDNDDKDKKKRERTRYVSSTIVCCVDD